MLVEKYNSDMSSGFDGRAGEAPKRVYEPSKRFYESPKRFYGPPKHGGRGDHSEDRGSGCGDRPQRKYGPARHDRETAIDPQDRLPRFPRCRAPRFEDENRDEDESGGTVVDGKSRTISPSGE